MKNEVMIFSSFLFFGTGFITRSITAKNNFFGIFIADSCRKKAEFEHCQRLSLDNRLSLMLSPLRINMTHLKSLKHSYLHRYQGHESLTYENPRFFGCNNNTLLLFQGTYTEFATRPTYT